MKNKNNHLNKIEDEEILEAEKLYSSEELDPYNRGIFHKIPFAVKAILIKYWFFGAIIFFCAMGSSMSGFELMIFAGVIGGCVFDIACNNLLETIEDSPGVASKYFMYHSRKVYSLFISVIYTVVLFIIGGYVCDAIVSLYPDDKVAKIWAFQEPFTQALVFIIFDMLFVYIKNLIVKFIKKQRESK